MAALVVMLVLSWVVTPWYARRVEHLAVDPAEKVHRLRRAQLVVAVTVWVPSLLALVELRAEFGGLAGGSRLLLPVFALVFAAVLAALVGAYRGLRPAYERVRGIEGNQGSGRRTLRAVGVLLLPQAVWIAALVVLLGSDASPILLAVVFVAFLLMGAVATPWLLRAATRTRELDAATSDWLEQFCRDHQVRIDAVRVIDTRHDPSANAAFAGFGPGPKYLFITDRLLEEFDPDERAAVVAHEIGHRRGHHIAIKLTAHLAAVVVLAGIVFAAVTLTGDRHVAPVAAVLLPIILIVGLLAVQGWVGIRLEYRADDYASATVGGEAMHRALDKLARLNMAKRHTSWGWNLLQRHPGLDQRLARAASTGSGESSRR